MAAKNKLTANMRELLAKMPIETNISPRGKETGINLMIVDALIKRGLVKRESVYAGWAGHTGNKYTLTESGKQALQGEAFTVPVKPEVKPLAPTITNPFDFVHAFYLLDSAHRERVRKHNAARDTLKGRIKGGERITQKEIAETAARTAELEVYEMRLAGCRARIVKHASWRTELRAKHEKRTA